MPAISLDALDAQELHETLDLIREWLASDPEPLTASLAKYIGHPAYNTTELRDDLARFVFLLGGDGKPHIDPTVE